MASEEYINYDFGRKSVQRRNGWWKRATSTVQLFAMNQRKSLILSIGI